MLHEQGWLRLRIVVGLISLMLIGLAGWLLQPFEGTTASMNREVAAVTSSSEAEIADWIGIQEGKYKKVSGPEDCLWGDLTINAINESEVSVIVGSRALLESVKKKKHQLTTKEQGCLRQVSTTPKPGLVTQKVQIKCPKQKKLNVVRATRVEFRKNSIRYTVKVTSEGEIKNRIQCELKQ